MVKDDIGCWFMEDKKLEKMVNDYFQELYMQEQIPTPHIQLNRIWKQHNEWAFSNKQENAISILQKVEHQYRELAMVANMKKHPNKLTTLDRSRSVEGALPAKVQINQGDKGKKKNYKKENSGSDSSKINGGTKPDYPPCKHCGKKGHPPFKCWRRPDQQYQNTKLQLKEDELVDDVSIFLPKLCQGANLNFLEKGLESAATEARRSVKELPQNILQVELCGIFFGLQTAWERKFSKVVIESDSILAIQLITRQLKHTYRDNNILADRLAKFGQTLQIGLHNFELIHSFCKIVYDSDLRKLQSSCL
ncbi:putative transposon Ty5-1 protein [Senna tora]|uniref:Putative transposon Ty5-1 protein n=1 Tax=Senna tora TaxID=362788 RepID=A0A834XCQ2_9FABA|nr:putative transposon Ty5-1 protein [Senna tora]